MTEDIKGRFRISISHGVLSASFTRDRITIIEARELGKKMAKVVFEIEDTKDVAINLEELARYEDHERLRR